MTGLACGHVGSALLYAKFLAVPDSREVTQLLHFAKRTLPNWNAET